MLKGLISIILTSFFVFAQAQEPTMRLGDLTVSVGAGKNRYLDEDFELFAPFTIPVNVNFGVNKYVEVGIEYNPVIFDDRSNVDLATGNQARNESLGGVQAFGAGAKVALYNDIGVLGFFQAGYNYSILDQQRYINGAYHERDGLGQQIYGGFGLRYQLGNEYGDIFPWYFEMNINWAQHTYTIQDYRIDDETQPRTDDDWDRLNFGSVDVFIKFGYRFRTK